MYSQSSCIISRLLKDLSQLRHYKSCSKENNSCVYSGLETIDSWFVNYAWIIANNLYFHHVNQERHKLYVKSIEYEWLTQTNQQDDNQKLDVVITLEKISPNQEMTAFSTRCLSLGGQILLQWQRKPLHKHQQTH